MFHIIYKNTDSLRELVVLRITRYVGRFGDDTNVYARCLASRQARATRLQNATQSLDKQLTAHARVAGRLGGTSKPEPLDVLIYIHYDLRRVSNVLETLVDSYRIVV